MSFDVQIYFLILFALITANLPFFSERRWLIFSSDTLKPFWQIFLEWGALFGITVLFGILLERRAYGFNHAQQWEFWTVVVCLYLVFAAPGFLYRYVWK